MLQTSVTLVVCLLIIAVTCAQQQARYNAAMRALNALEQAATKSRLITTGNEFVVGLYVIHHRFNSQQIQNKTRQMAERAVQSWAELVTLDKIRNETHPNTLLNYVQMLAMQQVFNSNTEQVRLLKRVIQERLQQVPSVKSFFSLQGKQKWEAETQWNGYTSACMNLIYAYFAHMAGLEKELGFKFEHVFFEHLFDYRQHYNALSFEPNMLQDATKYIKLHDLIYTVTHYFLTLTGYAGHVLPNNQAFAKEAHFLLRNLPHMVMDIKDPDIVGEMVDSLITLGYAKHAAVEQAVQFLLESQTKQGAWKEHVHPKLLSQTTEIAWFHDTMASTFGLRDVTFDGKLPALPFPHVLRLLQ